MLSILYTLRFFYGSQWQFTFRYNIKLITDNAFPSKTCVNCFILYKNHIRSIKKKKKSQFASFRIILKTGIFPYKEQEFGILLKGEVTWELTSSYLRDGWLVEGSWGEAGIKDRDGNGIASEENIKMKENPKESEATWQVAQGHGGQGPALKALDSQHLPLKV